ncbi:MAG: radical SAM protein [Thermodesulfobacteriota bacterium]
MNFKLAGILQLLKNFFRLDHRINKLLSAGVAFVSETFNLHVFDYFLMRHPLHLGLIITSRCNRNCPHCIVGNILNKKSSKTDMTLDDLKTIINKDYLKSIIRVALGGGEPLIHKELMPFVNYLVSKGLLVNVTTNCDLLTTEKAIQLLDAGVWLITISYYFDNGDKAAQLLSSLPERYRERIALHFHGDNIDAYRANYAYAVAVGFRHLMFDHTYMENDSRTAGERDVFADEFDELCKTIKREKHLRLYASAPYRSSNPKKGCAIVRSHYAFIPDGTIKPCCYIQASPAYGTLANPEPFWKVKAHVEQGRALPSACKNCHILGGRYM